MDQPITPRRVSRTLRCLMAERQLTVRDIQVCLGLETPQAVYKWLTGKCLPTVQHLYALSRYLNVTMEDILTGDGQDGPFYRRKSQWTWNICTFPM